MNSMWSRTGSVLFLLLAVSSSSLAFRIEYATDRQSALVVCDRALYRGANDEARRCYGDLLDANDDIRIKADAARSLGDRRGANGLFQSALEDYPDDYAVRTRWAELFVETHQNNEAVKLYQESLAMMPDYAPAMIGLAKIAVGRFEGKAREWAEEALDQSSDNVEAYLLLARMDLEDGAVDAADKHLSTALEIAVRDDLPPLDIYALKASVDLLRGTVPSDWTDKALAYNAAYGETFATPAHFYVITRRYREAVELYQRAVEAQPDLYTAHAELGVNLLRENRTAEAQQHLVLAYAGDPYSARTVNTLRLIDSFDNFSLTEHAVAAGRSGNAGVILRLHNDEAEVIEPYVLELVNDSIDTFSARYGFDLERPVVVELYPEHDDFAVRTSGLPGIGLLGVTFGYLVAMDSPSGRAEGDFHWGTTLWHEMAHVFTLEATNHLVPRWFSEGVSVYEEWSTGPLPGRHIPLPVLQAIQDDRLLPIVELDRGFIRPSYENQVIVSYMQAGLICEFIASNWGQQALARMLELYRDGDETGAAIEGALGISAGQFDSRFEDFIAAELEPRLESLDSWRQAQGSAQENVQQSHWEEALNAAARAVELYPEYVDEGSPYLVKAKAEQQLEQREAAMDTLRVYHRLGGHDPGGLIQLAAWLNDRDQSSEAISVLEDVLMVAPLREGVHADLGDWLLQADRADDALREYQAVFAMKPHDQASVHFRLAKAYLQLDEAELSREHLLYSLEIAPHFREAQQLLLETLR